MAKDENIFKRKDGRWEARYIKGTNSPARLSMGSATERPAKRQRKKSPGRKLHGSAESLPRHPVPVIGLRISVTNSLNPGKGDSKNPPV